ncbi:MAG: tetratricopeptide repeat protein [Pseudomonadota bacterium]|nr:tetratricopeptide repeat protein [Pseudomonadota bacterium]
MIELISCLVMKRKLLVVIAGLFLLLFLGMARLGRNSVIRRLDMVSMESNFQMAETALRSGRNKLATQAYRAAIVAYQHGLSRGGYYPVTSGEYLTAGNCYQQIRQPRQALQCYEDGLLSDPWSITLLTSLGGCANRLGEHQRALAALEKSQSIYPLKNKLRPLLQKLRVEERGERK